MYGVNLERRTMLDEILHVVGNNGTPPYSLYVQQSNYKCEVKTFFLEKCTTYSFLVQSTTLSELHGVYSIKWEDKKLMR
jgi:hypothetical protein